MRLCYRISWCISVSHVLYNMKAKGNILSEGPKYHMLPESQAINFFLLYSRLFKINYSIQSIHKQTDDDQTGLNLDELIWDELALVRIKSYTSHLSMSHRLRTTNLHNLGRIGLGQSGFRTNRLACDVKRVIAVQHWFLYALCPTLIFICPLLRTLKLTWKVINQWRRQPYFFSSEPFLKQGISYVYVIVDFIRMGLQELCASRAERELQNVKFLPTVRFAPGTFCLLSERATTELRRLMRMEWIKVHLVFTCAIFRNLPVALGRCSKIIFSWNTFCFTLYCQQTS